MTTPHSTLVEIIGQARRRWRTKLALAFDEAPIPYRRQNGGDYPDRHGLAEHLAPGEQDILERWNVHLYCSSSSFPTGRPQGYAPIGVNLSMLSS